MWSHLAAFLESFRTRHYSEATLASHHSHLGRFFTWCDERNLAEATDVTQPVVEQYQRWLFYYRKTSGRPLSVTFQNSMLRSVKVYFRWLTRQHLALFNPAAEIELGRPSRLLPRDVLTATEAECVILQPNVNTWVGSRDRAILETLYSTGIRRMELAALDVQDVDQAQGTLMVRQGKNRKDRLLPIGARARYWVDRYVTVVRPWYLVNPNERRLFLTEVGTPFEDLQYLSKIVRTYMVAAQIDKPGGCHIFRHTMATLMLENGADLRYVQEMLGHSDPSTTQIYTHVSIRKLQQIHQATHPAEQSAPAPEIPPGTSSPPELTQALEEEAQEEDEGSSGPDDEPSPTF
jgi:integrase/recombinase XerD